MKMKKMTTTSRKEPIVAEDRATKKHLKAVNKTWCYMCIYRNTPHFIGDVQTVLPVVSPTHAVVQPFAMVIKVFHTFVANTTVFHFGATTWRQMKIYTLKTLVFTIHILTDLKSYISFKCAVFSEYIHLDITQVTVQVLDDMLLVFPIKKRLWAGVALLGPDAGVCWVYSDGSNVREKVHDKCYTRQLYKTRVKKNNTNNGTAVEMHQMPHSLKYHQDPWIIPWEICENVEIHPHNFF